MNIKFFEETKTTKKNDPKFPLEVTVNGFIDENGELKTYWDFFKDFEGRSLNVAVTTSVKSELEETKEEE